MPITIQNLTYYYPHEKTPALRDINLSIKDNEFVLLLGPSGCGKSTLSLCFNGLIPHSSGGRKEGKVIVNGRDTDKHEVSELSTDVGIVFQDPEAQLTNLLVIDEAVFGPENLKRPPQTILELADHYLRHVGMEKFIDAYTYTLSGGEKQRVALASVMTMEPKILVLDEPTSNLDPQGALNFLELLDGLIQNDVTILAIEHQVDFLASRVDRVILMDEGEIVADGVPEDIFSRPDLYDRLGVWIPQVARMHNQLSIRGFQLQPMPMSIEDADRTLARQKAGYSLKEFENPISNANALAPTIYVKGLSCLFEPANSVLDDLDLQINPGDFLAIIGPNGAGKTTLAKHFVGLIEPQIGTVMLDDQDIRQLSIYEITELVGYVFQYPDHQFVTENVYDEVAYSLRIRNVGEAEVREKVGSILELFGLSDFVDRHPFMLSMGQKRRLSVATMLVVDQQIIILDEPTMGLDFYQTAKLMDLLKTLNEEGRTIILITHDMQIVSQWVRRTIVMNRGKAIFDGPPRQLFGDIANLEPYEMVMPAMAELATRLMSVRDWRFTAITVDELVSRIIM